VLVTVKLNNNSKVDATGNFILFCFRGRDVVKTFLHMLAVGTYSRLFEALASMLSRNTLNPADISIVSKLFVLFKFVLYYVFVKGHFKIMT